MLKPYAPKAQVIWSTPHPANVVALAAQQTMKKNPEIKGNPSALLSFLISADHLNPVEHAVICFRITDVSRACFDQHVRHRLKICDYSLPRDVLSYCKRYLRL